MAIWKSVKQSRANFEAEQDTGILGKNFTRFFNRIWNYLFKGFLGTTIVATVFPTAVLVNHVITLALVATCVFWAPTYAFAVHAFENTIYDFQKRQAFPLVVSFIRVIIYGFLQAQLSVLSAAVIHPTLSVTSAVWAWIRSGLSWVYDKLMYGVVIKNLARVPTSNSFLARRVSGPDFMASYFYTMDYKYALLMLQVRNI